MVDGQYCSLFIRMETGLEKTISLVVQNMVHINIIIKRPVINHCDFTHKRRISLFGSRIFLCDKIV